jgi:hypothetical protein
MLRRNFLIFHAGRTVDGVSPRRAIVGDDAFSLRIERGELLIIPDGNLKCCILAEGIYRNGDDESRTAR